MSDIDIPQEHAEVLVDPRAYADGRIFDTYSWLRANLPLGRASPKGFDPFWVVTRYDELRTISRDNKLFPYGDRSSQITDKASLEFTKAMTDGQSSFARSLVQMDPPDHMKYRLLTQSWFMPKHLKTIDADIDAIADKALARMTGRDTCDFVTDIALYYPLEVIMTILGVPEADLPFMLRLTQEVFAPLDPDSMPEGLDASDPAAMAQAMQGVAQGIGDYFGKITEDRRTNPRNDIATLIANAKINDAPMPKADMVGYYGIIATAGHDTTSSSSAAAMYALATQPEMFRRVKEDLTLVPKLVEEAIRWASPVKNFMRSVSAPTEIGGQRLEKGDWLMLCYASANRDESRIADGASFDIDRPAFDHVAFGYGPHVCLGQHLARRELIALFNKLLPALKSVELDGEVEFTKSFFVNGLKHVPIRYELERAPALVD